MSHYCFLDLFPVEILHMLFTYFSAHEMFFTFINISDYIDSILQAYSAWKLNFQSIRRDHFDLVCCNIQPEKVISLTLSDNDDTSGQSELFFSHFRIEQFRYLQSLTLVKIEFESLKDIFSDLYKLEQLKSLSFDISSITYKYVYSCEAMRIPIRQLGTIEYDMYPRILPRLTRLYLSHAFGLKGIPFPQLHHVKVTCCQYQELKDIIEQAPLLRSLDVGLILDYQYMKISLASSQLNHLRLTINSSQVSMVQMEQFLPNFPHLKHLELILQGTRDLIDGYRWELLTSSIIIFNFKFNVDSHLPSLKSFQTSFWREKKCWYVDCDNKSVFSVPYFSPVHIDIDKNSHRQLTTSIQEFITRRFNSMNIIDFPNHQIRYYSNIKNLSINCSISLVHIRQLVCLEQVKSLSIVSIIDLLIFQPYHLTIPNLYELKIKTAVALDEIKQIETCQLEQIRKLSISINNKDIEIILKGLFFCFPHIEYLIYISPIDSIERLANVIDGFVHLLNGIFCSDCLSQMMLIDPYYGFNSIVHYSKRLNKNNFTYRHQRISPFSVNTHWWIAPQPLQSSSVAQTPSGLQYIWHWIKHYFFSN